MARFRNQKLAENLNKKTTRKNLVEAVTMPLPTTKNLSGNDAYKLDDFMRLLTILNTVKLENQFYRSENKTMKDVITLVDKCARTDAYLTAQCIVYSRCIRTDGLRSVNQLAAAVLARYISGQEFSKRFYGLFDKKNQVGGTIFRPDDISEIVAVYSSMNTKGITNAMKKGFASALEGMNTYSILKYKSSLLDVINLVHPNPNTSAKVMVDSKEYRQKLNDLIKASKVKSKKDAYKAKLANVSDQKETSVSVFEAIVLGLSASADTWEVANSEAGQMIAKAVKEGKLSAEEAKEELSNAKSDNFEQLLKENKLGILAAIRNIRQILSNNPKKETIELLCKLLSDKDRILNGKIMPYQIDMANEVVQAEFSSAYSREVSKALLTGYESSIPNLKHLLDGETLVMIDMSGSMTMQIVDPNKKSNYRTTCATKANLIGVTIAKALNSDVIRFGSTAEYVKYNINEDVFSLAKTIQKSMGGTSLAAAWQLAAKSGKNYKRVFVLSDNECNRGSTYSAYNSYVSNVGSPYVYSVDLGAYGTVQMAGENVKYYFGFSQSMFEDIALEFNPQSHIDRVRQVKI